MLAERYSELSALHQTIVLFLWSQNQLLDDLLKTKPILQYGIELQVEVWLNQLNKKQESSKKTNSERMLENFVLPILKEKFEVSKLQSRLVQNEDLQKSVREYFKAKHSSLISQSISSKLIQMVQITLQEFGILKPHIQQVSDKGESLFYSDLQTRPLKTEEISKIRDFNLKTEFKKLMSSFGQQFQDEEDIFGLSLDNSADLAKSTKKDVTLGFIFEDNIDKRFCDVMSLQNKSAMEASGSTPVPLDLAFFLNIYQIFNPLEYPTQSKGFVT